MRSVLFDEDEGVLWARLNRPGFRNAINEEIVKKLEEFVERIKRDDNIRAAVITGHGKIFCAGADIKMLASSSTLEVKNFIERLGSVLEEFEDLNVPVIAAVNGYALGSGFGLAMACDIVIASERAIFGHPEINLGLIPGAGGTQRLARIIGWKKAMELCLTGEQINAQEAHSLGIVNKVVEHRTLRPQTKQLTHEIKKKPRDAIALMKRAINRGNKMSLREGLAYERGLFTVSCTSDDAKEGMDAFITKRNPYFNKPKKY